MHFSSLEWNSERCRLIRSQNTTLSHTKVFLKPFCKSQFAHKFIKIFVISIIVKHFVWDKTVDSADAFSPRGEVR